MAGTPCACDRVANIIYINHDIYDRLTLFQRKFWIWHEKGHIMLDTSDEIAADNYAFNHLAGSQYRSLKQIVEAAEALLDGSNEYHQERIDNLYARALEWDAKHPIQKLDKATAKQITALGTQFNNMVLGMGTVMTGQTQVVQSGMQTQQNNSNILIIAAVAAVLIVMIMK